MLRDLLVPGGRVLVETYGSVAPQDGPVIRVCEPGEVYTDDDYVYWCFSSQGLAYLAALAGYECAEVVDPPVVDGHPGHGHAAGRRGGGGAPRSANTRY